MSGLNWPTVQSVLTMFACLWLLRALSMSLSLKIWCEVTLIESARVWGHDVHPLDIRMPYKDFWRNVMREACFPFLKPRRVIDGNTLLVPKSIYYSVLDVTESPRPECPYHAFKGKVSGRHTDSRLRSQTLVITETGLHLLENPV